MDLSGGINTASNERDIAENQYVVGKNITTSSPGIIECAGVWKTFTTDTSTSFSFNTASSDPSDYANDPYEIVMDGTPDAEDGVIAVGQFVTGDSAIKPNSYITKVTDDGGNVVFDISNPLEQNVDTTKSLVFTTVSLGRIGHSEAGYGIFPASVEIAEDRTRVDGSYIFINKGGDDLNMSVGALKDIGTNYATTVGTDLMQVDGTDNWEIPTEGSITAATGYYKFSTTSNASGDEDFKHNKHGNNLNIDKSAVYQFSVDFRKGTAEGQGTAFRIIFNDGTNEVVSSETDDMDDDWETKTSTFTASVTSNTGYVGIRLPKLNGGNIQIKNLKWSKITPLFVSSLDTGINKAQVLNSDTRLGFLWIDGSLRIYDANLGSDGHLFKPHKWHFLEKGVTFFGKSDTKFYMDIIEYAVSTTSRQTIESYTFEECSLAKPSGGQVTLSSVGERPHIGGGPLGYDDVGLIVVKHNQVSKGFSGDINGWGHGNTADDADNYHFYASFVYENDQESEATLLNSTSVALGGLATGDATNDCTFIAVVRPWDKDNDSNQGTYKWDNRRKAVRIYWTRENEDDEIKYFLGEYKCVTPTGDDAIATRPSGVHDDITTLEVDLVENSDTATVDAFSGDDAWDEMKVFLQESGVGLEVTASSGIDSDTFISSVSDLYANNKLTLSKDATSGENEIVLTLSTPNTGHAYLIGDATGDNNHGTHGVNYQGIGIYHEIPPTIFTHAVKSGIRPTSKSINPSYKTAAMMNRKLYVGNVKHTTAEHGEKSFPDRMLKSLPNKFDLIPDTEFIDVVVRDGEKIIHLESFGNRLLQFKSDTLYVIGVTSGEEFLEGTFKHMGVTHPGAVTKTDVGIFWVNENGAYVFTGEGQPTNLIDGRIDHKEWADWINTNAITGYYPEDKMLIVIQNSNIAGNDLDATSPDIYFFNLVTKSWNTGYNILGKVDADGPVSNIINFTGSDDMNHTLLFHGLDESGGDNKFLEWTPSRKVTDYDLSVRPYQLVTKDIHGGSPHIRKKLYKIYITYKGGCTSGGVAVNGSTYPTVTANLTHQSGKTSVGFTAVTDFAVGTDWRTAIFKVPAGTTSNVYSFSIDISSDALAQNFSINDISAVIRAKGVK